MPGQVRFSVTSLPTDARVKTVANLPMLESTFASPCCLVTSGAFYERQKVGDVNKATYRYLAGILDITLRGHL